MLKVICSWCKVFIREKPCNQEFDGQVSHGICDSCIVKWHLEWNEGRDYASKPLSLDGPGDGSPASGPIFKG